MSEGSIARRYARALFEIASEKNALNAFADDLNVLNEALQSSKPFRSFLIHPGISVQAKRDTVKNIFAGKVSVEVLSLVSLLIERHRENILPVLVEYFVAMANEARNIVDAAVYTAYPLNDGEFKMISEQFGEKIGKTIKMRNEVDASIVGGLIMRIGDRLYDGSVKGKLNRFKQSLAHS